MQLQSGRVLSLYEILRFACAMTRYIINYVKRAFVRELLIRGHRVKSQLYADRAFVVQLHVLFLETFD